MTENLAARPQPAPWTGSDLISAHDQAQRQASLATQSPGQRVAAWIAWHTIELGCVSGSLALATWVDAWFVALTAAIGGGWAVHEWRTARHQRLLQGQLQLTTSPARSSHDTAHTPVTSKNEDQGGSGT